MNPPVAEIFLLFFTYGGLLMVAYTTLFWEWSGAASLGVFYLLLGAPIVTLVIALRQFKKRSISKYHKWSYYLALLYLGITPLFFAALYFFDS